MKRRDYIAEITSRRNRSRRRTPRFAEVLKRVDGIHDISAFIQSAAGRKMAFRTELAKYIPIGTVACVEGYFRMVFRDLIDSGPPFRENVTQFKDLRIGMDHVVAVQSKRVTLGEFVAHLLPAHGVEDIHDSMSTLMGEPFLERLKVTKAKYFRDWEAKSLDDYGMWAPFMHDLKALFEWRHIFAHELATNYKVRPRQIAIDYAVGTLLISGTEALMSELIPDGQLAV